jgi:hypothetical protein
MEEVTATATAIFNTGIFIPLGENLNIYNLDEVITKDGFGETKNFQYTLTTETTGVTVEDNRMAIESSASGEITIQVLEPEEGTNANAVTTPYVPYTAVFNTSIETPAPAPAPAPAIALNPNIPAAAAAGIANRFRGANAPTADVAANGLEGINKDTPAPFQRPNFYDLDIVITKYGFGRTEMFTYELLSQAEGVSVTDNILAVSDNAYGKIEVLVTGGGKAFQKGTPAETGGGIMQANATTKLYGFNSTMLELFNNETTLIAFQNAIASTKNDWPNLVSDDRKAIDNGGGIDNGGVTPLPS